MVARDVPGRGTRTPYRWLLVRRRRRLRVAERPRRRRRTSVPDADDFVLTLDRGGPDWHLGSVVYEIFPDRFATTRADADAARTGPSAREWDELPTGRGPNTPREWFGGDLPGIEQHLDHVESLGANAIYLTPIFPAGSTHRYDATSFDRIDPLLGGDEALALARRAPRTRAGCASIGDLTHEPHAATATSGSVGARTTARPSAASTSSTSRCRTATRRGSACRACRSSNWRSDELRRRMLGGRAAGGSSAGARRLADRRREHDRPLPRARPQRARSRARCAARCDADDAARRRARPRLPRATSHGRGWHGVDELRRLPAPGLGVAARRRAPERARPLVLGLPRRLPHARRRAIGRVDARVPRGRAVAVDAALVAAARQPRHRPLPHRHRLARAARSSASGCR